jgi:hypothetical protein
MKNLEAGEYSGIEYFAGKIPILANPFHIYLLCAHILQAVCWELNTVMNKTYSQLSRCSQMSGPDRHGD